MTRFDFDVIGDSPHLISRAPEKTVDPAQQKPPARHEAPPALPGSQSPAGVSGGPTSPT